MTAPDRELIIARLRGSGDSYRAIARDLSVSDWLVRKVARDLDGDPRPMRNPPSDRPEDGSPLAGWLVLGGVAAIFGLLIWAGKRGMPPQSWD